ncbi:MAG: D-sedoheptulose 7-phosphate isomerase [Candidatus Omnitrophica bacterium]|nr:D-sedoheptulose 7-phosphate isomerase [Candidatus Omnitrophota bacterium]
MEQLIEQIFQESIAVKQATLKVLKPAIAEAASVIIAALKNERRLYFFGNGGSAADSQHIAAEFIGRFMKERRSLPAIALTTDSSILTALGNDYSFDIIFSRQLEGLGRPGDVAFGISTSGNSKNVIEGINKARSLGMKTIGLLGCDGGKLAALCDVALIVPSKVTARIQESQLCVAHTICQLAEDALF